jgi:hypothetical protein
MAQELLDPAQEQAEVISGCGDNGVNVVPISAFEIVAMHPMVVLEMADHGLDSSSASHLAANGFCNAADLAANPAPEPVGIVVAAIALVAMDAADSNNSNTCELFEINDDGTERVAVVRIAMQRLGLHHELSALGRGGRRGNRHLAAELVRCPCLAAADALHLGGRSALALLLMANPQCKIEQRTKAILPSSIALDLAANVADNAAKSRAQEF